MESEKKLSIGLVFIGLVYIAIPLLAIAELVVLVGSLVAA